MLSHSRRYLRRLALRGGRCFSKGPRSVDIELSNRCNLRCRKCWFHGESGIGDRYRSTEMATEEVLRLIDQLAAYKPHLYFGGGEPLIRDDLLGVLAHAKSKSLSTSLTTNGTLLDQRAIERIVSLKIDWLNVSIDGPEEVHDQLRGQGTFRKVMASIRCLAECKSRNALPRPAVTLNVTINPLIVGHLRQTIAAIKASAGEGVQCLRIHHLWFITPRELQAHRKEVGAALACSAPGAGSHSIPSSQPQDSALLAEEAGQSKSAKVVFFPDLAGEEIRAFYAEGYRSPQRCMAPFQAAVVKPNGDVRFCPDEWIDDYVLGNVRDDPFATIWNNDKARHFRSVLWRQKAFPACHRCSWMYCFGT